MSEREEVQEELRKAHGLNAGKGNTYDGFWRDLVIFTLLVVVIIGIGIWTIFG